MYVCVCVYMELFIDRVRSGMCVYICVYVHACMYVCTYGFIRRWSVIRYACNVLMLHVYMYVYMKFCVHSSKVYMHTDIHKNTNTYRCARPDDIRNLDSHTAIRARGYGCISVRQQVCVCQIVVCVYVCVIIFAYMHTAIRA